MLTQEGIPAKDLPENCRRRIPRRIGLGVVFTILVSSAIVFLLPVHAQSPLTIQPSMQRVGIGTTSPGAKLHVSGDMLTDVFYVTGYSLLGVRTDLSDGAGQQGVWAVDNYTQKLRFFRDKGDNVYEVVVLTKEGKVGIGTSNPGYTLQVNGSFSVSGYKYFEIRHPLDPDNKVLTHSSLEGPEASVYYRGEAQLEKGEAQVVLPAYFEALTRKDERTVQLTPVGGWSPLYVMKGVEGGKFLVRAAAGGNPSQRFYWEVKAVRADLAPVEVERVKPRDVRPEPYSPKRW